ncbi:uncharacterized protein LOC103179117 isoform X1 [Callorhinchus milii]|uniref:High mobility group protein HMG-I/HMG-Y n=1 Tax=Callorhinchus milii TaxID=7868 RepID=V9L6D4_CALMI|nr:uncharacterized protein LOC103179117 isoform X1 [Callorhinchus milii]XP_042198209.1 uncharacterized protein LOC103179117 isoform X1 [Callorhinchus milii]|eukprot:gi/632953432/ref/XP_007892415.1/ PREDICTED: high mobility group protein HMG-I/HMG-Y isoform X2 [Callorhinchus milii]
MSDTGAKANQPSAIKQDKDATPRRGRGRPRKELQEEPAGALTPKRPRGRPKGSKNKSTSKSGRKSSSIGGGTPRGRPKKLMTLSKLRSLTAKPLRKKMKFRNRVCGALHSNAPGLQTSIGRGRRLAGLRAAESVLVDMEGQAGALSAGGISRIEGCLQELQVDVATELEGIRGAMMALEDTVSTALSEIRQIIQETVVLSQTPPAQEETEQEEEMEEETEQE